MTTSIAVNAESSNNNVPEEATVGLAKGLQERESTRNTLSLTTSIVVNAESSKNNVPEEATVGLAKGLQERESTRNTLSLTASIAVNAESSNNNVPEEATVGLAKGLQERESTRSTLSDLSFSNSNHAVDDSGLRPGLESQNSAQSNTSNRGKVSFGSVRIHKHRMSLGDNPGVSTGVPVTLAWEVEESLRFDSIEEAAKESGKHGLHRISRNRREEIANQLHSRSSIVRLQDEIKSIQVSRTASERDTELHIRRVKAEKKQGKRGGGLFGMFKRKK
jgi:hypothetical protein